MITLALTDSERSILEDVLNNDLSDLRMEIANTDSMDFRQMLKQRKDVIVKVLETLRATTV